MPRKKRSTNGKKDSPGKLTPQIPASRLWLFRFCAAILIPLVVFGVLELGLRLASYGYPTSFFLKYKIDGREFYVPNERFGNRFFPPAIARTPLAQRMAVEKAPDTYRIFVFGESAAMGDPDSSYGAWRYLQVLLQERYPGIHFEVICVAITAIDSNVILPIARDCAGRQGDLWVVYMGNNEMVGPFGAVKMVPFASRFSNGNEAPPRFGAETAYGLTAPPLWVVRTVVDIKTARVGQLMDNFIRHLRSSSAAPKQWAGMEMFMNGRIGYDNPARLRAYANFKGNLEDILNAAHRSDAPVILSTVAVNLRDCPPFASIHTRGLRTNQLSAWNKIFDEGVTNETAGAYHAALDCYRQAANLDPQYAELQYRMGRCDLALTNETQALQDFKLARDYDALDFRADTRINSAIRDEAARRVNDGVHLVDAAKILEQDSSDGIPGLNFFYEHVHLNFAGNYLLGRIFADKIKELLPNSITARDTGGWASEGLCERRLAVTVWDRRRVWQPILDRITGPPFTGQSGHETFLKECEGRVNQIEAQMKTETPEQARQIYEQALALAPNDYFLHFNFAQYLGANRDLPQSTVETKRVCELLPQVPGEFSDVGNLLVLQAKMDEAAEYFSRALAIRTDFAPALNGRGLILQNRQKSREALACFKRALRADPGNAETCLNIGFFEQDLGNSAQAADYYRRAASLQPGGAADYFNRAFMAATAGQSAGAIEFLEAAIQLKPEFWQAHYLLGVELAGQRNTDEAARQFWDSIIYRPDYARSHLNLGIALMNQKKMDKALTQFQITQQLDPSDSSAARYIASIRASTGLEGDLNQTPPAADKP